jgi:hypothetical protein
LEYPNFSLAILLFLSHLRSPLSKSTLSALRSPLYARIQVSSTMRQDRLPINMSVTSEPMLLPAYIEDCRMKLWDQTFNTYFKDHDSFKKADDFVGFNGTDLLVRRVLFRYVSNLIDFNNCFSSSYLSCYFRNSKMYCYLLFCNTGTSDTSFWPKALFLKKTFQSS